MSFFNELKRRNVFRVGVAYLVGGWLLLQLTDVLSELLDLPDVVGRTVVMLVAIGLPVALLFAWAFEMTPEGVKREKDVDRSQSVTPQTGRKLNRTILVMLVLGISYLLYDKLSRPGEMGSESASQQVAEQIAVTQGEQTPPPDTSAEASTGTTEEQSIAVLPFESFSGDQSDQYFADGLADTLLHKLAQISELKVIARNSSFQFKGTNKDIREIGKILDVKTVLEGSVQRAGDQVRIIAQLINTSDGVHIWSQSFDDSMDNIFALQDRVAADIVDQLQVSMSKDEEERLLRNGTDNPEAYDLLMQALNLDQSMDELIDVDAESWEPLQSLIKVVELDPQYAEAWSHLSFRYNSLAFTTDSAEEFDRFVNQSRAAAEEAMKLDPGLDKAHEAMGWVEHRNNESLKAARHFRRALELNPNNGGAMSGLGLQLKSDPEEALRLFTRVHEIEPTSIVTYRQKHFALMMLGRPDEAIEQLELAVEAAPEEGIFYNDLSDLLIGIQGRPDEAGRQVSRLLQISPRSFEGVNAMVEIWTEATDDQRASAWVDILMAGRDDSDDAKLLNASRLITAARYHDVLLQLDEVKENENNEWQIVSRRLLAHLGLKESAKAAEYAAQFRTLLNEMKARGAGFPGIDMYGIVMGMLAREQANPTFDVSETVGQFPPLERIPFLQNKYFLQAGVQARMGNIEQAMARLELTLSKPDGGVFNTDILGFSVEESLLLNPLRSHAEFEAWLLRYRARRDAMLQHMIEMENRGEIIEAAIVERMTAP